MFLGFTFNQYYKEELIERLTLEARVLEPRVKQFYTSSSPDFNGYKNFVRELASMQVGLGITVLNTDGVVEFSSWESRGAIWSHLPEILAVQKREIGYDFRPILGEMSVSVSMPMSSESIVIGMLSLKYPAASVYSRVWQVARFIIATFFIALLIGAFSIYNSVKIQTEPLNSLIEVAGEISGGNLDTTFEAKTQDEVGQLARALQVMVTRLKTALNEASREKGRFEAMFQNMVDGLMLTDSSSKVLLVNLSMLTIFGVSSDEMIGNNVTETKLPSTLVDIAIHGEVGLETEIHIGRPSQKVLRVRIAPIEQEGRLTICEDVTRMRGLEASEREFIQYISHELKTPLASLGASVETVQTTAKSDKKAQIKFLAGMSEDVERLTNLVNSLLTYQRVRDIGEQMERFGAVQMLFDVHDRFIPYATKKKVMIELDLTEDEIVIIANKDRIIQVLYNLIDNALRFTPENGRVTIGMTVEPKRIKIYIQDTGIGIPKDYLNRLGERFIKIPRKDERFATNVGLGIAICKEILSTILSKQGYSFERAILPMKLVAVRSGLGKYGKNNLCYVDGMGSYTRLEAFYTDYEFPIDTWCEKGLMKSCNSCSLCQHACPTQCIPQDRLLIHADHCLTYFNENEGDFPPSIPVQSHNALIGCMLCQIICPQNKKYFEINQDTITFTEEEIACILQKTPRENIPQALAKKLVDLDIYEDYPELQRNLTVLMNKEHSEMI